MDRDELLRLWNEHHADNTWITATRKALDALTPAQAAWKPAPERHSIWQTVNHLNFWHAYFLSRKRNGPTLTPEQIARRNWPEPETVSDPEWRRTLEAYDANHAQVAAAIADPDFPIDSIPYLLTHTAYHTGQIMQLRAMQGMSPIE